MNPDLPYWLAINECGVFGPKSMEKLRAYFGSMKQAFEASLEELICAGIREDRARDFISARANIDPNALFTTITKAGVSVCTIADDTYPILLREIYDPPAVLYILGILPDPQRIHIAVVGSRHATSYGLSCATSLSRELAKTNTVIVSGLAYGIDEAAHEATLQAGGITIAVLGSGILNVGTTRQHQLANKIVKQGGAIISEFPLRMPGFKTNFPVRNRIISGLSQATLIIEATEKSGSLITAKSALEQNREVFAVPGPINSETSKGPNNLIKMGAHPATCAEDILSVLNIEKPEANTATYQPDSKEEALILPLLGKNPIHIDDITRQTKLPPQNVASTLSLMEMKGRTKHTGGMNYIII